MQSHATPRMQPSEWVTRFIGGVRNEGTVLDVACGGGRHLILGADRGLCMTGLDRDVSAAQKLLSNRVPPTRGQIDLIAHNLEDGSPFPFAHRTFDGVIVTNYLWRPILPAIVAAVAPAGVLIYETFAVGNERLGRPSKPDFLLRPGELLEAVRHRMATVAFEHVRLADPDRIVQRICAVGPQHPWLTRGAPSVGFVLEPESPQI